MSGTSSKTTVISLRLPNKVVFTLKRRINGRRSRWASVGELPAGACNLRYRASPQVTEGGKE